MRKIGPILLLVALAAAGWMFFHVQVEDSDWSTFGWGLVAFDVFFGLMFLIAVGMAVWSLLPSKKRP